MAVDHKNLVEAGKRCVRKMDEEDLAAMKLCLLSTGALFGLSMTGKLARRLTGLAASVLAAGLAVPLATRFASELEQLNAEKKAETVRDDWSD